MRPAFRICVVVVLLEISCFAVGNCDGSGNCYVSKIATGTGTGADWTNACTDFTGACDVTSASMRGTTIWVGGTPGNFSTGSTWTGPAYTVQNFTAPNSGKTPITIIGASGDNHGTDVGFRRQLATGIITFTGPINITTDYWVFNGQYRAYNYVASSWPNVDPYVAAGNGGVYHDQKCGYHMQVIGTTGTANGVVQVSGSHVTLEYVYVQGSTGVQGTNGGIYGKTATDNGIYYSSGVHDEYVGYSWIGYTGADLISASAGANFTFEYNLFTKNHMGPSAQKSQAINIGDLSNLVVRYNHFQDILGSAVLSDGNADATAFTPNWYFYSNDIFWDTVVKTGAGYGLSAGIVNLTGETLNGGVIHVYNNTIAGLNVAACTSTQPCNSYALNLNGTTGGSCAAHTQNCIGATAPVGTVYNNLWWNPKVAADVSVNTAANPQWTPTGDYGEGICATTGCTNGGSFTVVGANDVYAATGNPFKSFNAVMGNPNWYNFNLTLTADTAPGLVIPGWSSTPPGCTAVNCENADPHMTARGVNGTVDRGIYQINSRQLLTIGTTNSLIGPHIGSTFQLRPVCRWSSAPTSDNCPDSSPPFVKQWSSLDATVATVSSTGLVTAVSNHNGFIRLTYGGLATQNIVVVATDGAGTEPIATLPTGIVRTGSPTAMSGYDTSAYDAAFPTTFADPCPVTTAFCTRWKPLNATDFPAALASSHPGDTIELQAGTTYVTNGTFFMPAKANPSHKWIYIVSSNMSSLPPQGTRIKPSDAANMPKIVAHTGGIALVADVGADHWWIAGIEMYSNGGNPPCSPCNPPGNLQTSGMINTNAPVWPPSGMVDSITVDRCYLHGDDTHDVQHLVTANASHFAILDSYIGPSATYQAQSNAASSYLTPGPMKVINNFFWGYGQGLIWGGAGGFANPYMLYDSYIARNTFWNRPPDRAVGVTIPPLNPHQVCSNFELKTCERCLVDGNIMQNSWISCQSGGQVLMNLGTWQSGPDQVVSDLTFSNNIMTGSLQGLFTSEFAGPGVGCDLAVAPCFYPGEQRRLDYFNNLFVMGPQGPPGGRTKLGSNSFAVSIPRGMADELWQHNTFVGPYLTDHTYCDVGIYFNPATDKNGAIIDLPPSLNIWLLDNVSCRQTMGAGSATVGTPALNALMGDPSTVPVSTRFRGNVMQLFSSLGDTVHTWPANNQATFKNFTYVDPTTGNYQLVSPQQPASDGWAQTGIDYATLMAHQAPAMGPYSISGTVSGVVASGVALTITGGATSTVYANPDGSYSFPGLAAGNYIITSFQPGYAFSPANISVSLTTASVAGQNFTSTATTIYSINGTVSGAVAAGVTIKLSGTSAGSTTTDSSGNYSFASVGPGSYTVTPTLAGYAFSPTSHSVTVTSANVTGQNFTSSAGDLHR